MRLPLQWLEEHLDGSEEPELQPCCLGWWVLGRAGQGGDALPAPIPASRAILAWRELRLTGHS